MKDNPKQAFDLQIIVRRHANEIVTSSAGARVLKQAWAIYLTDGQDNVLKEDALCIAIDAGPSRAWITGDIRAAIADRIAKAFEDSAAEAHGRPPRGPLSP